MDVSPALLSDHLGAWAQSSFPVDLSIRDHFGPDPARWKGHQTFGEESAEAGSFVDIKST
jgi:hypothetical protein